MQKLNILLFLLFVFNSSFSQDAPSSSIIGDELMSPGAGFEPQLDPINPDAQLYMPEVFSPTETLPPSRERETLLDSTNTIIKKQPVFWGGISFSGQYGQFDELPYTDIYISPYITWGPLFLMYEVPLRFDWNSAFISRMWNSEAALISKIEAEVKYSKTNHVFRHVQASVYRGEELFLGHGKFFYDYNPNLYNPYEPFKTFKFSLDVSYIGVNYILANIAQPDLMSAEIYIRPLAGIKNPKLETYKDFKIYGVYGADFDPYQGYSPALYEFSPNSLSPEFQMFEVGVDLPVFKNNVMSLELFGDYAKFLGSSKNNLTTPNGSGLSGGLIFNILNKIPIRFEVSKAFGEWQPRWVNVFYYVDRAYVDEGSISLQNKYTSITPNLTYYNTAISFNWFEKSLLAQIELYGDFYGQDMWLTMSFTLGNVIVKQLSLSFYLTIRDLQNIQTNYIFNPQYTVIDVRLKYHMMPNMFWGLTLKMNGRIAETFNENAVPTVAATPFIFLGIDYSFRF